MTYDTNGTWRCYEIKVSKQDFYSNANLTFVGHYNYFVLPQKLYEEVKHDIPEHIGVYLNGRHSVKRAKRQELKVDEEILKDSMIRSLFREYSKQYRSGLPTVVESKDSTIRFLRKELDYYRKRFNSLQNLLYERFGRDWRNVLKEEQNAK